MQNTTESPSSWLDRPIFHSFQLSWENIFFILLLVLAVASRFYLLEPRVMSHDETIHVYHNSYSLFSGQGYRHDPLSHGPFQTHVIALSYFLFGDNDVSARIPAVLFSIATIGFVWFYRRYLGRSGMLIAMGLMAISPYLLYYGRYARNESYAAFSGVVLLWAILRYLETGKEKYTYWVTLTTVLHFTAKETSFIYTAQALVFLGLYMFYQIVKKPWLVPANKKPFFILLVIGFVVLAGTELLLLRHDWAVNPNAAQTVAPAIPGQTLEALPRQGPTTLATVLLSIGALFLVASLIFLIRGFSWTRLRQERSLGLFILIGTLVLPMLSAFPVYFVGWNVPTNATEVNGLTNVDILHIAIFLVPFSLAAIVLGLLWKPRLWLINAALFYGFFTILYTTIFTNGAGFFTGLVGSLGYWLKQQGVQRGSQPWYYYLFVQIPVYEYLPALASMLGGLLLVFGKRPLLRFTQAYQEYQAAKADISTSQLETGQEGQLEDDQMSSEARMPIAGELEPAPVLPLLVFYAVASLAAYTLAGEKMPWLTVHIAWPLILFGGWALGYLVDTTDWSVFRNSKGWLVLLVLAIFLVSFSAALGSVLGPNPPFVGMNLDQLSATSTFVTSLIVSIVSGIILWRLISSWPLVQFARLVLVTLFAGSAVLTMRTAFQASYINYDDANELLVYAHSAGGVKEIIRQVEEISRRTTDGNSLIVAHDGEYPFWWYLRHYPNARFYGSTPSRSLREAPVIIAGDNNFGKMEAVVGQAYNQFEYIRLWWPNQDYFNLTWDRIKYALTNPQMRSALFDIWLNRDYSAYGAVTGRDMSLENWSPAARMRLYIRKDITSQLWNYGSAPVAEEIQADPYEGKQLNLSADTIWGAPGTDPGLFQRPRGLVVAPDGTLYVADTDNHRIQRFSADGAPIAAWGKFADTAQEDAPGGDFNQPWGIAISPDGSVFVADTWNHRVQKFSLNGEFLKMWGYFGTAEQPEAFWGPRDVAVDAQGRVFVTDTGNKRVVVFDGEGNYLTQFGQAGLEQGQFDEPVGLALDNEGRVYVADTWNQRIQVFREEGGTFVPDRMWEIAGWYGQSLDNKPYLAVDTNGNIFVTDPEGYRVLQFDANGEIIRYWGDIGSSAETFGLAGAVTIDPLGGVWVSDAGNSRLMHFTLPAP